MILIFGANVSWFETPLEQKCGDTIVTDILVKLDWEEIIFPKNNPELSGI